MSVHARAPCDDLVIGHAPALEPQSRSTERWVLAATVIGSSMAFIDGTVVNVALPELQRSLGATVLEVQWVVESYALMLAALIVVGGALGDYFGRRRVFAVGIVLFAAASMWCGMVPDVGQLIAARAVQGIGGALLIPGSLAILSSTFSAERRGAAIGMWSGLTAINMAVGPVLGGWLVEHASWRWIFYINIPAAFVVLAIVIWRVPESHGERTEGGLDWPGALLATIGLGAIVLGLIESSNLGLGHPFIAGALAVGVAALVAFILVERRSRAPMMPLGLFRSRSFSGANLLTLMLYAALGGALFFLPFNLVQVQGYSATAAGAAFLPLIAIMAVLSRWSGRLLDRFGARVPLTIGPLLAAAGFALFAIPGIGGSYWVTFFPAVAVLGLGMAVSVAPLTTAVMNSVGEESSGVASGVNNAVARLGSLVAVAAMGMLVLSTFNGALDARLAALGVPEDVWDALAGERIKLAAAQLPAGIGEGFRSAVEQAVAGAFVSAFRLNMLVAAGLALIGALTGLLFIDSRGKARTAD
ncbi:MAG: MFS transporter [SAR324 cluster bacterium]|nr:MFS transporter [SAR324 cluster bacterium]